MGRWIVAVAAACCVSLGVVGTASAAPVPISGLVSKPIPAGGTCSTTPSPTAAPAGGPGPPAPSAAGAPAGAHRDYCVAFNVDTSGDDVKKITIGLPGGVVGDPGAVAKCPQADFEAGNCDAAAQVGTVWSTANVLIDMPISGHVYNLVPAAGEPARLGISLDQGG